MMDYTCFRVHGKTYSIMKSLVKNREHINKKIWELESRQKKIKSAFMYDGI